MYLSSCYVETSRALHARVSPADYIITSHQGQNGDLQMSDPAPWTRANLKILCPGISR